jgi:1,4-dihydroxy-6-naphthoate synthase
MPLALGYSPCPNDCFIFFALAHDKIRPRLSWEIRLADVEALNQSARSNALDVTKVSYHAFAFFTRDYIMLPSGGALGRGVGPLIVTKESLDSLSGKRVAIPGGLTTANLLLRLSQPTDIEAVELRYDSIMPAVARGEVDAGLIIHESRFTYPSFGLHKYLDLGAWWEGETGHLLPLGGIMARRSLGRSALTSINIAIQRSLAYAYQHSDEVFPYLKEHAQEMANDVIQQHLDLYVNGYTSDLGKVGRASVRELLVRGHRRGLLPEPHGELFFSPKSEDHAI